MSRTAFAVFIIVQLSFSTHVSQALARSRSDEQAVTCRTNTTLEQERGGGWLALDKELELTSQITVFTNAEFQVKDGKMRKLRDRQILRADGYLLNPDGSTEPVCDHLIMKDSSVLLVKDGEGQRLTEPYILPNGTAIEADGSYAHPNGGRRSRLVDGQMLKLNGETLPGLDTISLRDGKVVVYKSGALFTLDEPNKIQGMFDGTRVNAQGLVTANDRSSFQLAEGQTITVPGVRASF